MYVTQTTVANLSDVCTPSSTKLCLQNGRFEVAGDYWVFFGSLTDQSYQVVVTDTGTGVVKTYAPPAALCGTSDTTAFAGP